MDVFDIDEPFDLKAELLRAELAKDEEEEETLLPTVVNTSDVVIAEVNIEEQRDYILRTANSLDKEGRLGILSLITANGSNSEAVSVVQAGSYINLDSLSDSLIVSVYNYIQHKLSNSG